MGTSEDAFGVFTHDTDGDRIDIGQEARYRPGWLSFWQNRFYVSIYLEKERWAEGRCFIVDLMRDTETATQKSR